jgi:copper(I)-binding protein
MRTPLFASLAAALLLAGCNAPSLDSRTVAVEGAVVTLPAVSGRPGAAYFKLESHQEGISLRQVASTRAARTELHEAGMRPTAAVPLPRGEPVAFAPGGRHVMLFELDPALRPGERIPLTFTFDRAEPVTVEAEVRAPGDVHGGN